MEIWKNLKEMIEYPKEGILSKTISEGEVMEATLFCMAKGTSLSEHTSTREAIIYVIEGNGTFTLRGKDIEMRPGVFITMEKNAPHSLKAEENTSFLLILGSSQNE